MIKAHQILRNETGILLGIGLDSAVLDFLTSNDQLRKCLELLDEPHRGLVSTRIGMFGVYPVTLNLHYDESVSICIDGPDFQQSRNLSAGLWVKKEDLKVILREAVHQLNPHAS